MVTESQRTRDIARAALLRERIVGALKANADGMTTAQLCDYTSVAELYHVGMLPLKVGNQLRALQRDGTVDKAGTGNKTTYFIKRKRAADQPAPVPQAQEELKHLHLEVSKSQHTVSFVFEGLQITVKVLP